MPLPLRTSLGRLRMLEVYDVYDGPRIFSTRSATGNTYFAFWSNDRDEGDEWLYVPVTPARLDDIIEGAITLRAAFINAEDGVVFRVNTGRDGDSAEPIVPAAIPDVLLPREDDRLSGECLASSAPIPEPDGPPQRGRLLQEITLQHHEAKGPIPLDAVASALSGWRGMFLDAMSKLGGSGNMFPLHAAPGSLRITVAVPDTDEADGAFEAIQALVASLRDIAGDIPATSAANIRKYDDLLNVLRTHQLSLVVRQNTNAGPPLEVRFDLPTPELVERVHDAATRVLDSGAIPQADRLDRVLRLVELVAEGVEITSETLEVVHRQVNYYKQACRILRLLDNDNLITPAGEQLIAFRALQAQLALLAVQFETSECGWRWIVWSKGSSLLDVKANTGAEFLSSAAPSLSPSTTLRRARTLEAWRIALTDAHYLHHVQHTNDSERK